MQLFEDVMKDCFAKEHRKLIFGIFRVLFLYVFSEYVYIFSICTFTQFCFKVLMRRCLVNNKFEINKI